MADEVMMSDEEASRQHAQYRPPESFRELRELRDMIAMAALGGILSGPQELTDIQAVTSLAWDLAEAMMAVREERYGEKH